MTDFANLILFRSAKGENSKVEDWKPVNKEDAPDWVKEEKNLARMLKTGAITFNAKHPEDDWWLAIEVPTLQ